MSGPEGPHYNRSVVQAFGLQYNSQAMAEIKNPGIAAVLSAIIPGIGQFYNGDFLRGIFWLIVTPGLWIGSGGTLGWICHVVAAITAHRRARIKNEAHGV